MKLGLIIFSVVIGLFIGTGYALATTHVPVSSVQAPVPPEDIPVVVELASSDVYTVPTVTITGVVSRHKVAAKAKTWQCGEVYTNAIGGRNSDCFWK